MMIFSSSEVYFALIVSFCAVEGTLTPGDTVSVECGTAKAFTCNASGVTIGWNIAGLSGINIPGPFLARHAMTNPRITSPDSGANSQIGESVITISGFSLSDNGGTIQCVNKTDNNTKGMATVSVIPLPLPPPTNVTATVESCDTVTLQWDQPSEPADITTSVSCTPPSPGCAECTTSPCTITGLDPSTEYEFTVTLTSGGCRANMSTTTARTIDTSSCVASNDASNAPLAALVLLLLPIPLIYALGVLIAYLLFFKDKTYCEVFWCCFCWRKDKSYESNSTKLREHRVEAAYQTVPKKEEILTNGDEIKEPKKSKQEVVTDEAFKKQEAKNKDVITDETVQQQGMPDEHHKQKRSRKYKEEVQHQNLDVAKNQEAVTNGDEVKKPKSSKQEIQYADLDFSDHQPGRNVIIPMVDPVTYADVS